MKGKVVASRKNPGSFDYQQCAGNAGQTLVGNGRNWKAEKSKILKFAVLKLPHIAFGISGFCFLKASPRCHWAVLSLYKFVFLICWGRKCKWNEFFSQSLEDKVLSGKVSLLRGGLQSGRRPTGAEDGKSTLFITFSLSHLIHLESDGVR